MIGSSICARVFSPALDVVDAMSQSGVPLRGTKLDHRTSLGRLSAPLVMLRATRTPATERRASQRHVASHWPVPEGKAVKAPLDVFGRYHGTLLGLLMNTTLLAEVWVIEEGFSEAT